MKQLLLLFIGIIGFSSCDNNNNPFVYQKDAHGRGKAKILVEQSFQPLFETSIATFMSQYPRARVQAQYMAENDIIEAFYANKSKTIVVTRDFNDKEKAYLKSKNVSYRSDKIATDAVVLILHPSNTDTILSVEQIKNMLSGEQPNGWGSKTYMGYLKPKDIASYLMRDYGGNFKIIEQYSKGGKVGAYSAWTIGQDLSHLPNKYYFLYNQDSGVRKGFYSTKKEANEAMAKYGYLAKGGKIGFEGLSKKVAKRYVGKKVSKEYQAEYGKTYDAKEAKEVGNKVAGKVYKQQVAKKKIVRKLQRKTK